MHNSFRSGFTLVEIMIVAAVIAVILAIVVPNFLKAGSSSSKNTCINNLRQIDAAVEQWACDNNISSGVVPTSDQETDIYSYLKGGRPACPSKGIYSINGVNAGPQVSCSRAASGHKLAE